MERRAGLERTLARLSGGRVPTARVRTAWASAMTSFFVAMATTTRGSRDLVLAQTRRVEARAEQARLQLAQLRRESMEQTQLAAERRGLAARELSLAQERERRWELRQSHIADLRGVGADVELVAQLARRHAEMEAAPGLRLREELRDARELLGAEQAELGVLLRRCIFCREPADRAAVPCGHLACERHDISPCVCGMQVTWHELFPRP